MGQRALHKAIRYFGSQQALAKAIGVKQQSISNWLNREESIPYMQVLKIAAATKGYVTHHALAPHEKYLNKMVDELIKINLLKLIGTSGNDALDHSPLKKLVREAKTELPNNQFHPVLVDTLYHPQQCDCQLCLQKKLGHQFLLAKMIFL